MGTLQHPIQGDEPSFWLIWSPEGLTEPRVRFDRFGAAQYTAERMAKAHPDQTFYVLKSKTKSHIVEGDLVREWTLNVDHKKASAA